MEVLAARVLMGLVSVDSLLSVISGSVISQTVEYLSSHYYNEKLSGIQGEVSKMDAIRRQLDELENKLEGIGGFDAEIRQLKKEVREYGQKLETSRGVLEEMVPRAGRQLDLPSGWERELRSLNDTLEPHLSLVRMDVIDGLCRKYEEIRKNIADRDARRQLFAQEAGQQAAELERMYEGVLKQCLGDIGAQVQSILKNGVPATLVWIVNSREAAKSIVSILQDIRCLSEARLLVDKLWRQLGHYEGIVKKIYNEARKYSPDDILKDWRTSIKKIALEHLNDPKLAKEAVSKTIEKELSKQRVIVFTWKVTLAAVKQHLNKSMDQCVDWVLSKFSSRSGSEMSHGPKGEWALNELSELRKSGHLVYKNGKYTRKKSLSIEQTSRLLRAIKQVMELDS